MQLSTTVKNSIAGVAIAAFFGAVGWHYWSAQTIRHERAPQTITIAESIRVPILTYHTVRPHHPAETIFAQQFEETPAVFGQQLDYLLQQGYNAISFRDLIDYFKSSKPLPAKPVILTFDDGWETQYEYVFPELRKRNLTATFFIFTNAIGRNHYMSWDQIGELDKAGMTIGSHTKFHPYLFKMTDHAALWKEIAESKDNIESRIHKPVYVLAYPFGLYNDQNITVTKEAGYEAARSGNRGWIHTKDDLFTLKSIYVANNLEGFIRDMTK